MNVRYTRRAFRQTDAILDHIGAHSPQGAHRVKKRIQAVIDALAVHPHSGPLIGKSDLRRLVVNPYPYLIFYRIAPDAVVIHGVRHAARLTRK